MKQPYAELLVTGKKTIESRRWCTTFRGDFYIHASKNIDIKACEYFKINIDTVTKGSIIGKANIYDVKKYQNNEEFILDKNKHLSLMKNNNRIIYGYLIKDALKFKNSIPYLGKLGFFEVNQIQIE
ncbi:MAG: ASCH domain-containing protein [Thermoproteota archaeon]|nr:ASCH domain-containing protein [Thermoproteota archaeon]